MTTHKIRSSKVNLLKALLENVKESLENSKVNPAFEADISEIITQMRDKKTIKRLKVLKKELEDWIQDMEDDPAF